MCKAEIICVYSPSQCHNAKPWNIQGRRMSTSESSKCKDQSSGERKRTQAQATPLSFGDKKDKGGKMEEADIIISRNIHWPGTSELQLEEPHSHISDCALMSRFPSNQYFVGVFFLFGLGLFFLFFLFLNIYNKSKVSHTLKERNPRFWPGPSALTKEGWTMPKLQLTQQQCAQQRGTCKPQTRHSGFSPSSATWATAGSWEAPGTKKCKEQALKSSS